MNIDVTATTRTKPGETETRRNMAKRTSLLGRSRPSERLTREEIAALDKVALPPEPPPKPPGNKGDGQQRMVRRPAEVSLEPRLPRLRLQGHRRWPAQARAASGEVRPLQSGPGPGGRVMVRTTPITLTRRHRWLKLSRWDTHGMSQTDSGASWWLCTGVSWPRGWNVGIRRHNASPGSGCGGRDHGPVRGR